VGSVSCRPVAIGRSSGNPSFKEVQGTHVRPSHLLKHLFRESDCGLVSDLDVRLVRHRLWDASVLRARLSPMIERRLADHRTILEKCASAAPEKVVRLLRCTLQLASLEAADAIGGTLPGLGSGIVYRPHEERAKQGGNLGRRVFLCHATEDKASVRSLYKSLAADGFDVWFDERSLYLDRVLPTLRSPLTSSIWPPS
jgi:hypothetical protein